VLICGASLSSGRRRRRFEATAARGSLKLPPASPGFFFDLAAQSQFLDQAPVALQVSLLQIVEEPSAAADELEQSASGVMILPVRAQMLGQLLDPAREQGDLNLGRTRVSIALAVAGDDFQLGFFGDLAAESQFLDQAPVALQVSLLQVVQESSAAADELQQPAPGVMILPMRAQMLGQLLDPA